MTFIILDQNGKIQHIKTDGDDLHPVYIQNADGTFKRASVFRISFEEADALQEQALKKIFSS